MCACIQREVHYVCVSAQTVATLIPQIMPHSMKGSVLHKQYTTLESNTASVTCLHWTLCSMGHTRAQGYTGHSVQWATQGPRATLDTLFHGLHKGPGLHWTLCSMGHTRAQGYTEQGRPRPKVPGPLQMHHPVIHYYTRKSQGPLHTFLL